MIPDVHNSLVVPLERLEELLRQRSFDHAGVEISYLHQTCLGLPDPHWLACLRAAEGRLAAHCGQPRAAISLLLKALEDLDRRRARRPFDRAVRSLALCLRGAPAIRAAFGKTLRKIRLARYRRVMVAWALHRWLEGLVFLRRGQIDAARPALRGAVRQLLAAGELREAGLAVLDWAEACLADYAGDEARGLAQEVLAALQRPLEDRGEEADPQESEPPAITAFAAYVDGLGNGTPEAVLGERARQLLSRGEEP